MGESATIPQSPRDNLVPSDRSSALSSNLEAAPARAIELTEETTVTTAKIEEWCSARLKFTNIAASLWNRAAFAIDGSRSAGDRISL
jgi:hypothetical protein